MKAPGKWEFEFVTPDKAKEYLGRMPKNRRLRRARVRKMAAVMSAGRFRVTHQGIAFSATGTLKDGQHRLNAIVDSGTSQWMWVYYGLDDDAVLVIDTHIHRSDADGFTLSGVIADNVDVAVARRMQAGVLARTNIDRDDLRDFLESHREAIDFTKALFPSSVKGVTSSPCLAVFARAYYSADHARLQECAEVLKTGITPNGHTDGAAIRLREFLRDSPDVTGGDNQRLDVYRKCESAIQAFLERRPLQKLYGWSKELFPIPGE